jgi:hypothetical protein
LNNARAATARIEGDIARLKALPALQAKWLARQAELEALYPSRKP